MVIDYYAEGCAVVWQHSNPERCILDCLFDREPQKWCSNARETGSCPKQIDLNSSKKFRDSRSKQNKTTLYIRPRTNHHRKGIVNHPLTKSFPFFFIFYLTTRNIYKNRQKRSLVWRMQIKEASYPSI